MIIGIVITLLFLVGWIWLLAEGKKEFSRIMKEKNDIESLD